MSEEAERSPWATGDVPVRSEAAPITWGATDRAAPAGGPAPGADLATGATAVGDAGDAAARVAPGRSAPVASWDRIAPAAGEARPPELLARPPTPTTPRASGALAGPVSIVAIMATLVLASVVLVTRAGSVPVASPPDDDRAEVPGATTSAVAAGDDADVGPTAADGPPGAGTEPAVELGTLPPVAGSDESGSADPPVSAAEAVAPEPDGGVRTGGRAGDPGPEGSRLDGSPVGAAGPVRSVALRGPVAAVDEPLELVVRAETGDLHTISLPSGTVRTLRAAEVGRVDVDPFGRDLVVTPDAAVVVGDGRVTVVPRTGPPRLVDLATDGTDGGGDGDEGDPSADSGGRRGGTLRFLVEAIGWIDDAGRPVTVVRTFGNSLEQPRLGERTTAVAADGSTAPLPEGLDPGARLRFDGAAAVDDAGGTYLVDPAGATRRVSSGRLLASGPDHLLLRECDDARACRHVVTDLDGGAPRVALVPERYDLERALGATLSPDASHVAFVDLGASEHVVIELASGKVVTQPLRRTSTSSVWAPDGSGSFVLADRGLSYLDATTGEATPLGAELGTLASLGGRRPDGEILDALVVDETLTFT